jgi:carbamoyl-phosphate synthase small subunit
MLLCDATDDVDTRAITRRLREDGSLIGVLSTDNSKTDEELLQMSKSWDIVGKNDYWRRLHKCF